MVFSKITSIGVTMAGGFFVGVLIGFAIKRVIKVVAMMIGLF